jgi:hypothetical protein
LGEGRNVALELLRAHRDDIDQDVDAVASERAHRRRDVAFARHHLVHPQ